MRKESKACTPLFSDSHRVKGLEICSCHFPLAEGSSAPRLPWQCTPLSKCTKVKRGTRDRTELEHRHHQQRAGARGCGAAIPPLRSVLCLQACAQLTFTSKSTLFLESSLCFRNSLSPHPTPSLQPSSKHLMSMPLMGALKFWRPALHLPGLSPTSPPMPWSGRCSVL